jgi:DNA invertase Pin-like site-specific DNA recombinase
MTPKAYSYIRFSTPDQLNGDSLRRQLDLSKRYAAQHGLVLDENLNLQDLGLSAYHGEHREGALGRFLELVKGSRISEGSVLLVESLDRLSREEITEALEQFLAIIRSDVKIVTLADNEREYTKETINANVGELIVSLTIMSRAHEESKMKSFRLGRSWKEKRNKAVTGERKLTAKAPAWLSLSSDKKAFIPVPERVEVIERIFREKLSGKSAERVAKDLNLDKAVQWEPKNGWRKSYVQKILRSHAVIGTFQPHRLIKGERQPEGEPLKGYFPPVISEELFYRVQAQFREDDGKKGRNGKINNLFGHIAKCGYCGAPMQFVSKGKWLYLVCDRAKRKMGCEYISVRYPEFEKTVLEYCKGLNASDLLPGHEERESQIRLLQSQLSAAKAKLEATKKRAANLLDTIADSDEKASRDLLKEKLTETLEEQSSLEQELDLLTRQIEKESNIVEDTGERLESLSELLRLMDSTEGQDRSNIRLRLRQEIRRLLSLINVFPGGQPRMTPYKRKKILKAVREVSPKAKVEIAKLNDEFWDRINNPKKYLTLHLLFSSGSARIIHPTMQPQLTFDFDKIKGVAKHWIVGPEGEEVLEFTSNTD